MKSLPVFMVTGFLGAGKTTFINRLLERFKGRRIGLLVNEVGEAGLEGELLVAKTGDWIELPGGCLCCVGPSDLERSLSQLKSKTPALDLLVIEASGLSHPGPVIRKVLALEEKLGLHFTTLAGLVDCQTFLNRQKDHSLIKRQLELCDNMILTKVDLVSPAQLIQVQGAVKELFPGKRILEAGAKIPWDVILAVSDLGRQESLEPGTQFLEVLGDRVHGQEAKLFQSLKALEPRSLGEVLGSLDPGVLRAKGRIFLADPSGSRWKYLFQYTGVNPRLSSQDWAKDETRQTLLAFFGNGFDWPALEGRLRACET